MGKTKITTKTTEEVLVKAKSKDEQTKTVTTASKNEQAKTPKKKVTSGILFVDATFNNTKVLFGDKLGNTLFWSSAGSLGFKGAAVLGAVWQAPKPIQGWRQFLSEGS